MFRGRALCSLVLLMTAPALPCLAAAARHIERIPINSGWTLRQLPDDGMAESQSPTPPKEDDKWLPAVVPGDVQSL